MCFPWSQHIVVILPILKLFILYIYYSHRSYDYTTLLFLLPPSCMVAPIGNTVNKFISPSTLSTTIMSHNLQTFIPTVNESSNTGMNKSTGTNPVNNSNSRGRTFGIERNLSRDTSMSSTCSSVPYHKGVTMNNGIDIDSNPPTDFPALSYEEEQEKELRLRKAAETTTNTRPQGGINETSSI